MTALSMTHDSESRRKIHCQAFSDLILSVFQFKLKNILQFDEWEMRNAFQGNQIIEDEKVMFTIFIKTFLRKLSLLQEDPYI